MQISNLSVLLALASSAIAGYSCTPCTDRCSTSTAPFGTCSNDDKSISGAYTCYNQCPPGGHKCNPGVGGPALADCVFA